MEDVYIRLIEPKDDAALAKIIRGTLEEFGANKPGTVYYDNSTDYLSKVFETPRSVYYVLEQDGHVLGGAGIYPTAGLDHNTCELVKMYLLPKTRGKGLGKLLVNKCMEFAKNQGFTTIYLETMPELATAVQMYEKMGFKRINRPLGNSGHCGCDIWMTMQLKP